MDEVICSILRTYPSVSIQQFSIPYLKGGLTYNQIQCMYDCAMKERNREYEVIGAFHGVSVGKGSSVNKNEIPAGVEEDQFIFKDPSAYAHMTQEEREELTQKMLGNHQRWAGNQTFGKGMSDG